MKRLNPDESFHGETSKPFASGYGVFTPLFGRLNFSKLTQMCAAG
jgi:hypothetical protein